MDDVVGLDELLPWFKGLDGYKRSGSWHVAKCPLHDDRQQSLGLSPAGVLRCYAGCAFGDLMRLKREQMPDDNRREVRVVKPRADEWEVVERYQYVTIDGTKRGAKTRLESRTARRENGKPVKRFTWSMEGGGTPSDHGLSVDDFGFWPDPADDGARRVFITEGEKAASAVRARNEIAICPPGSASNVPPKAALELLRGREVIIWRDLDAPGLRWAEALKKALRYIAASVRIVVAPGEEGDDAHDFFSEGGNLDDLLSVTRAITERLAADHYRVTMPSDYGPVVFDADEVSHHISHGKSELNMVMRVILALPGTAEESYVERINIYSSSGKAAFVSALANQFDGDKKTWTRIVNSAFEQIDGEWKQHARASSFVFDPARPAREFLVDQLFPAGHHSVLFAPPATGKSFVVQEISLCVSMGLPFVGLSVKQGPVLILDYESQRVDWEERWERLLKAHGFDAEFMAELPVRYLPGGGIPLAEQWRIVKREVDELGAVCLIIDSAMPAAGGDMFSTSVAAAYFSALDRIGVTSVTIGQVPAADNGRLYGNQQWQYAPHGRIWQMEKQQGYGSAGDVMEIAFTCKKSSNGRPPEPFAVAVEFEEDRGPVRFRPADLRDVPEYPAGSDAEVIERWLRLAGPALPAHELAKETQLEVERVLTTLRADARFVELRSNVAGIASRWGLAATS